MKGLRHHASLTSFPGIPLLDAISQRPSSAPLCSPRASNCAPAPSPARAPDTCSCSNLTLRTSAWGVRGQTVEKHFNGPAGLIAHLKHIGNWDYENDCIKDTCASGNSGETPQFLTYAGQDTRKQVASVRGVRPHLGGPQNRETVSPNFTWSWDGFQHLLQVVCAREHFTEWRVARD